MKIANSKWQIANGGEGGFTLIELLVSMGVIATVGVIIGSIFVSSLRGTNKANTVSAVKQNGFYAIAQMSKMLRDAKSLNSPCLALPPSPTPQPTYSTITFTSFDDGQTTFSCDTSANPPTISSNSASLLDTTVTQVANSSSCSFTCTRTSASDYPIIGINFTLTQSGAKTFFEQQTSIPFQTSVTLRNITR